MRGSRIQMLKIIKVWRFCLEPRPRLRLHESCKMVDAEKRVYVKCGIGIFGMVASASCYCA
jgi:hypothetical protein